jgi:hypothetical protein
MGGGGQRRGREAFAITNNKKKKKKKKTTNQRVRNSAAGRAQNSWNVDFLFQLSRAGLVLNGTAVPQLSDLLQKLRYVFRHCLWPAEGMATHGVSRRWAGNKRTGYPSTLILSEKLAGWAGRRAGVRLAPILAGLWLCFEWICLRCCLNLHSTVQVELGESRPERVGFLRASLSCLLAAHPRHNGYPEILGRWGSRKHPPPLSVVNRAWQWAVVLVGSGQDRNKKKAQQTQINKDETKHGLFCFIFLLCSALLPPGV